MLVKDLIAKLQELPGDEPVYIADADTGWLLEIQRVGPASKSGVSSDCKYPAALTIAGDYDKEMH
jgi:hypothetical protein